MRRFATALLAVTTALNPVSADDAPALDPFVQQFVPQLRQMLKTELQFAQRVCQPTPEQFRQIEAAGNAAFNAALKKISDQHQQMQRGRAPKETVEPRDLLATTVAKAVGETLAAEPVQRYQLELQKRREARQHAALLNLVAQLDRHLGLTTEQRTQLVAALGKDWKDAWGGPVELFQSGEEFLPSLPDDLVAPVLNAKQRDLWKAAPKRGLTSIAWFNFGPMGIIELEVVP